MVTLFLFSELCFDSFLLPNFYEISAKYAEFNSLPSEQSVEFLIIIKRLFANESVDSLNFKFVLGFLQSFYDFSDIASLFSNLKVARIHLIRGLNFDFLDSDFCKRVLDHLLTDDDVLACEEFLVYVDLPPVCTDYIVLMKSHHTCCWPSKYFKILNSLLNCNEINQFDNQTIDFFIFLLFKILSTDYGPQFDSLLDNQSKLIAVNDASYFINQFVSSFSDCQSNISDQALFFLKDLLLLFSFESKPFLFALDSSNLSRHIGLALFINQNDSPSLLSI
ncbi:hypothetical protein GEMRC1_012711 [Eukaryota sp. GEM-RC1]